MPEDEDESRSTFAHGLPWMVIFPKPDGTLNEGDRAHLLGFYRGLTASVEEARPSGTGMLLGVYNND